jgi:hypothetical protein
LPSAKVVLHPQGLFSEMQIEFRVDETIELGSTPGVLSAAKKSITLDGETTVQTTGSMLVPDKKALGNVSVSNLSSNDVSLPRGTIVQNQSNPPVRYQLIDEVLIPAEEVKEGIMIEALEPGIAGNADANTITSLEGKIGFNVQVVNPEPITGGISKAYQAVSQADIELAEISLQTDLKKQVGLKFAESLTDQEIGLPASIQAREVLKQSSQPEVGQAGKVVKLKQSVDYTMLVINRDELEKQAGMILNANQAAKDWNNSSKQKVDVQILSQHLNDQTGSILLKVSASQMLIPPLDLESLSGLLAGKSKPRAFEIINTTILNSNPPEILTIPDWLPFLPLLSTQIQLEVN